MSTIPLVALNEKLNQNLENALDNNLDVYNKIDLLNKAVFQMGESLNEVCIYKGQTAICNIFTEIFSDVTMTTLLVSSSHGNIVDVLKRRILELGVAIVYLWDRPQKYWEWSKQNSQRHDLSFSEMIDVIYSEGYKLFLYEEFGTEVQLDGKNDLLKMYRSFSNVVHGKEKIFNTTVEAAFDYDKENCASELNSLVDCILIIMNIWKSRFKATFVRVHELLPGLQKII